ncbi:uncharacterized protein LOC122067278 [Macadamia integrifolia]|uniref:uncharacterized protein LOC122067278 n=1 Tax=Macadamia integrifolia TaxID=60698 RepID=UPI001C4F50E5|nr:uncharacterized protein LOC122067278 [Macadamia integrifolia]
MSEAQLEHVSTVEDLAPSLVALRVSLCPSHMNEGQFWLIYFILLYPRLNEHDSKLLSTSQVIEARDFLLQKVHERVNEQVGGGSNNDDSSIEVSDKDTKIKEESNAIQEKEVLAETLNAHLIETGEQEISEQWLEEEDETDTSIAPQNKLGYDEDVSFSDLEDDDDTSSRQWALNTEKDVGVSSPNVSNEWFQLSENSNSREKKVVQPISREKDSEGEESNDWLTVDGYD